MRLLTVAAICCLLFVRLSLGEEDPEREARWRDLYSEAAWKESGLAAQTEKFKSVALYPRPDNPELVAADRVSERQWWSSLVVFRRDGDKIAWLAKLPKRYEENCGHYLLSCKWRYLDRIGIWVLEVFDSTHMGNGSLWLFELKNRQLRLLLHTRAVDNHIDGVSGLPSDIPASRIFESGRLTVTYPAPSKGKFEQVRLSGIVIGLDDEDREMSRATYTENWSWNATKHIFVRKSSHLDSPHKDT